MAAVIPQLWIMKEKSRATTGVMSNASVITGKATDAPPSDVAPAIMDPKIIVMVI